MQRGSTPFPVLRWAALAWFAVWFPTYAHYWGWSNFLHVCDVAVALTCAGLWWGNSLLLSSQAVNAVLTDLLWCADAAGRLAFSKNYLGGTEYMWDSHYPVWVRALSLFHVFLPLLLLWSLRRVGYDRRGLALQAAITAALLAASRFFGAALNLNYAFVEPVFHRSWGPAPLHLFLVWLCMLVFLYWPVHLALKKFMPAIRAANSFTS
jgi:hypothetical protein